MTLNKELLSLQEEFCPFYQHCEQNGLASRQCEDGEKSYYHCDKSKGQMPSILKRRELYKQID